MNGIDQFIWGYQLQFRVSLNLFATRCFEKLAKGIYKQVFLLGILRNGESAKHKICIEPDDCNISQEMFNNVEDLALQLESVSPEKHVIHTLPEAQESHDHKVTALSYRDAVLKCIEQNDYFNECKTYVSASVNIDKYSVFICLQLKKKIYDSFYKLTKDTTTMGRQLHIHRSIIDSLAAVFLSSSHEQLRVDNSGYGFPSINEDDQIRKACDSFMYAVTTKGEKVERFSGLFEKLNIISSMKYEKQETNGSIIICKKEHENIKMDFTFVEPIALSSYRKVRKILELTSTTYSLICDSCSIYGIGHFIGEYNPVNEDLFLINFTGFYKWELLHDQKHLINVEFNKPFLPTIEFKRDQFFSDINRIFKGIEHENIVSLYNLICSLIQCRHGAILVICSDADRESERLKNQSLQLKPFFIDESVINKFSNIDGAILIRVCL
jgi:hypothetical protein